MPKWSSRPLHSVIADALRSRILSGEYQPGTPIREEEVAADFGVSRVPVREALHLLAQQQFVTLRPRRSAIVASPSAAGARDLMAIRCELEGMAARLAAAAHGGQLAAELSANVVAGERALAAGELELLPPLIDEFHELVAVASGNGELASMLRVIRRRVDWLFAVDLEQRSPRSWADHRHILDAILTGDQHVARELMTTHVFRDELLFGELSPATQG